MSTLALFSCLLPGAGDLSCALSILSTPCRLCAMLRSALFFLCLIFMSLCLSLSGILHGCLRIRLV